MDISQVNPLQLLPPEIWKIVFEKLKDVNDLRTCFHTHPAWNKLLLKPIEDLRFQMTLPFLLPYLSKSDLLGAGQVCRLWNSAIDSCLQTFDTGAKCGRVKGLRKDQQIKLGFNTAGALVKFENGVTLNMSRNKQGAPVAANPMLFRNVELSNDGDNQLNNGPYQAPDYFDNLISQMNSFLAAHGHLIRNLQLDISGDGVPLLVIITMIRNCLVHTPHLRVVSIDTCTWRESSRSDVNQVVSFLELNPWPELKHLSTLTANTHPAELLHFFLNRYGPQLEHVTFVEFERTLIEPVRLTTNLSSILSLNIETFEMLERDYVNHFCTFVRMGQLCSLKTLVLYDIGKFFERKSENVSNLIYAVNALHATLQHLTLHRFSHRHETDQMLVDMFSRLRLPNLKSLALKMIGVPSAGFLQEVCPSLQHLYLKVKSKGPTAEKKRSYDQLYKRRDFWQKMACMKSVRIRYRAYHPPRVNLRPVLFSKCKSDNENAVFNYYRHMMNFYK